jgi:hypothetical protein
VLHGLDSNIQVVKNIFEGQLDLIKNSIIKEEPWADLELWKTNIIKKIYK